MTSGHDERGRFTTGNTESRGRQITALKRALLEAVTPEDMAEIAKAIAEKAKQGDTKAAELLFNRLFGKPAQSKEPEEPLTMECFYDDEQEDDQQDEGTGSANIYGFRFDTEELNRRLKADRAKAEAEAAQIGQA